MADAAGNPTVKLHDFSHTLYHWAYDYFNSVNDLVKAHPGLQLFTVKYNNVCLAFELIVKAHIAYVNHTVSLDELDKLLSKKYGHSIIKLAEYAESNLGLRLDRFKKQRLKLVDKYYSKHQFRYPPYEPRKSDLNHAELLEAIQELQSITAVLLVAVWQQTKQFRIE